MENKKCLKPPTSSGYPKKIDDNLETWKSGTHHRTNILEPLFGIFWVTLMFNPIEIYISLRIHVLKYDQKCYVTKIALHVYCGHIFRRLMVFDGVWWWSIKYIYPASPQSLFQAPGCDEGGGHYQSQNGIVRIVWEIIKGQWFLEDNPVLALNNDLFQYL